MLKRIITLIVLFALIITMSGGIISSALTVRAEGANNYSGPLADLGRDESFDKSQYPLLVGDKSLSLIQVAEGSQNELYIYVYQPGGTTDIVASSINISKEHKDLDFKNYTLTLVSQEGVFHKYLVNGFTVDSKDIRYYEITSIYRAAQDGEDTTLDDNGNTITEVPYAVKKFFKLTDESVYAEDIDVISVTSKYVGFMRYPQNAYVWCTEDIDVHFIAFTTDRKIDKLLEADIYYTEQSFSKTGVTGSEAFGEKESKYVYISYDDKMEYTGSGWFSLDYEWNSIETSKDFLNNESKEQMYDAGLFDISAQSKVDEESLGHIKEKDWVIRFVYTDYSSLTLGDTISYTNTYYSIIGDVSIMRLAFETDGVYYNLGVIDNKQSGDLNPDNTVTTKVEFDDTLMKILGLILIGVMLIVLKPVFVLLWEVVKICFKGLVWLICLPFRIIRKIFK